MSAVKKEKLLVALDGSKRSKLTVEYVSGCPPLHAFQLVLFHVFHTIPQSYYDLQKEPKSVRVVGHVHAWENEQNKKIQRYMKKAKQTLIQGGFAESDVEIKIVPRARGIARDIIREARQGYAGMVLRRRGSTRLSVIMGGVATKVVTRNEATPLLIAGRVPPTGKVLLATDGSANALRAADFAGRLLAGTETRIHLVAVLRGTPVAGPAASAEERGQTKTPGSTAEMAERVIEARQHLIRAGVASELISWQVISGVRSRAAAIVEEAKGEGCDTIVVGRRGHSRIDYFFIGSVSSKVIQLGRKHTVWVIP